MLLSTLEVTESLDEIYLRTLISIFRSGKVMVCLNLCLVDNRAIRVAIRWSMCYCSMAGLSRKNDACLRHASCDGYM